MLRSFRRAVVRTGVVGTTAFVTFEVTTQIPSQGRSSAWYHWFADAVMTPLMRTYLDPETAHWLALIMAQQGLAPTYRPGSSMDQEINLSTTVWGIPFDNPIGLGAGFDKNGEAMKEMLEMGFGFVEIGSVTPLPQPGNPKPRMFRLPYDGGIINRYGFNSEGIDAVQANLEAFRLGTQPQSTSTTTTTTTLDDALATQEDSSSMQQAQGLVYDGLKRVWRFVFPPSLSSLRSSPSLVGVNLGKNKWSEDEMEDYRRGMASLGPYADYVVINISSPNTPGLRDLQTQTDPLQRLLRAVLEERNRLPRHVPLLVKLAPDLTDEQLQEVCTTILSTRDDNNQTVDGLIVSNTTETRPSSLLSPKNRSERGGLSGRPLRDLSTHCIGVVYAHTQGEIPIVGVGGISSAHDVLDKIKAGASLVEIYSVMIYEGPGVVSRMRHELARLLRQEGFRSVEEAVGHNHEELYWKKRQSQLNHLFDHEETFVENGTNDNNTGVDDNNNDNGDDGEEKETILG